MTGTFVPTGSLTALVDALVEIEETVHSDLRVYRWQPLDAELPALWNWLGQGTFEIRDQARWRDSVTILARVGVDHNDDDMDRLMAYADAFRDVVDDALYNQHPVNGRAVWAERLGMNMQLWDFNGVNSIGIEFPLQFRLDRRITPNA